MTVRRRSNGLSAPAYVRLVEVDGRHVGQLLAALATDGVAAYVTSAAPVDPDRVERPRSAVHVDSTRRPDARRVLEATLPDAATGLPSVAEEDTFAALVAAWHLPPAERNWPAAEDIGAASRTRADKPAGSKPDHTDHTEHDPDPEDHFVPPTLPPLAPSHPITRYALVALALGLILLIVPTLLGLEHSTPVDFAGVLCILGAVGTLVARLQGPPTDSGDGAVV